MFAIYTIWWTSLKLRVFSLLLAHHLEEKPYQIIRKRNPKFASQSITYNRGSRAT